MCIEGLCPLRLVA